MARTKLSKCAFVDYGYGQVEPNLLSAQRTGQIYAQLPAAEAIEVLENGQFAKYDYATNGGEVNFTGAGEWMLVYNEVKVYRDLQRDCDFAMVKGNYEARVYSPITGATTNVQPVDWTSAIAAADPYEIDSTGSGENDARPMGSTLFAGPAMMNYVTGEGKTAVTHTRTMVPRLLKTNVGDIFTTNTIANATVEVTNTLAVNPDTGILTVVEADVFEPAADNTMRWQVVKVYTMPDGQKGAKIMRIA